MPRMTSIDDLLAIRGFGPKEALGGAVTNILLVVLTIDQGLVAVVEERSGLPRLKGRWPSPRGG